MSLQELLDKRAKGQGGALLHGSDIPPGTKSVTITVVAARESPDGFEAPIILDFKPPINGKSSWAVNKSNSKMLMKLFGDDEKTLVGRKIRLEVVSVRNPKSGEIVRSLAVSQKQ